MRLRICVALSALVVAACSAGGGSGSTVPEARAPDAPTGVVATAEVRSATVSWTAPTSDGGSALTGYAVLVSPPVAAAEIAVSGTSATITHLANGTTYTFQVIARNAVGTSAPSTASAPITTPDVPGAPTGVTAAASDGRATVTWTAPSNDGGSALTGYTVRVSPAVPSAVFDVSGTTAVVTGLANGTSYAFQVHATNAAGDGPASSASAAVVPFGLPGAPTGVSAVAGDSQVTVSWTAPPDNGASVAGYVVTASPGGLTKPITGADTTVVFTGLANGTAYTFTVAAVNAAGRGSDSAPSAAIVPARAPDAPTNVVAQAGVRSATLSWTAPASDGGSPLTGYTVIVSPATQTAQIVVSGTGATVTGLANATSYTFQVKASNAAGTSAPSQASAPVTTPDVPGAPTGVAAVAGDRQATVTWTAPASNGGSPLTGFTVVVSPTVSSANFAVTGTTAVVTGLANGTAYTFQVFAKNGVGDGPLSASSAAVTPSATCVADQACALVNPCRVGTTACVGDQTTCVDSGAIEPDGTSCGDGQTCNAGACVAVRDVTVTRLTTWWGEDGKSMAVPAWDIASIQIDALVAGSGGAARTIPGERSGSTWTIRAVPTGGYRLRFVNSEGTQHFIDTASSTVDLGWDEGGRGDIRRPTQSTTATLGLTGLTAWSGDDRLQLFSWGAGIFDEFVPPSVAAGATSAAASYDFLSTGWYGPDPLLASSDRLYVLQHRSVAAGGGEVSAVASIGSATGISMSDGASTSITASMSTAAPNRSATIDWKATAFESHLGEMGSGAVPMSPPHSMFVVATPFPDGMDSGMAVSADLLTAWLPGGSDVNLGSRSYWNPFPAAYGERFYCVYWAAVPRAAQGATPLDFYASIEREDATVPEPIVPAVTPVRSVLIAGHDAMTTQSSVGASPTLSWLAPEVGTPDAYLVVVYELSDDGGATASRMVATLRTAATQASIPEGVLSAGKTYVATIEATAGQGTTEAPYRFLAPYGRARLVTQTFSP